MRLRSDEQLVELFRAGHEDAFCAIHDRYRKRLLAYAAQMLNGSGQDAEDALQDVFERAYCGLRAHDRDMALRAWLYRVAHNRCLDQLRRPVPTATVEPDEAESRQLDPVAAAEQRETLRRLIIDISRLPDQQRSALLLREMSGMSYAELAGALGVSVPAVKSLLVRARIGLAAAIEARDTACSVIREELVLAHDRGARPAANVRRHLRDCSQCRHFRRSMRTVTRNVAALTPALGPIGLLIKLLGGGGGAAGGGLTGSGGGAVAGGSAVAGGGSLVTASGALGTTGVLTGGFAAGGVSHVAALVAAALVTAGGAVAAQPTATPHVRHAITRPVPVSARAWSPQPATSAALAPAGTPGRPVTASSAPAPARPPATAARATASTAAAGAHTTGTAKKAKRPAGSGASSTPSDPTGSATSGAGSTATAGGSSVTATGSDTSGSSSTSTADGSPVTAAGGDTGTSVQSSSGAPSATSSSETGSPDSTTGSTSGS